MISSFKHDTEARLRFYGRNFDGVARGLTRVESTSGLDMLRDEEEKGSDEAVAAAAADHEYDFHREFRSVMEADANREVDYVYEAPRLKGAEQSLYQLSEFLTRTAKKKRRQPHDLPLTEPPAVDYLAAFKAVDADCRTPVTRWEFANAVRKAARVKAQDISNGDLYRLYDSATEGDDRRLSLEAWTRFAASCQARWVRAEVEKKRDLRAETRRIAVFRAPLPNKQTILDERTKILRSNREALESQLSPDPSSRPRHHRGDDNFQFSFSRTSTPRSTPGRLETTTAAEAVA